MIAVEKLNIKGLARTRMSRSVLDAGWNILLGQLRYKAEDAGAEVVEVNARNTSRTCPACGTVKPKMLSERTHACSCGLTIDRDVAAAQVILSRAEGIRRVTHVEASAAGVRDGCDHQVDPVKREGSE